MLQQCCDYKSIEKLQKRNVKSKKQHVIVSAWDEFKSLGLRCSVMDEEFARLIVHVVRHYEL